MTPSESIIPYGFCHCGCGRKTSIALRNGLRVEAAQCRNDFETLRRYPIPELYIEGRVSIILELAPKGNLNPPRDRSSQRKGQAIHLPVFR